MLRQMAEVFLEYVMLHLNAWDARGTTESRANTCMISQVVLLEGYAMYYGK